MSKAYTKEEIKEARSLAYTGMFRYYDLIFNKDFKYDARTRIGKLAFKYYEDIKKNMKKDEVISLKKERLKNKPPIFLNILSNKIVVDYFKNKASIKAVYSNHIAFFDGRNHWAKNNQDLKILAILKKFKGEFNIVNQIN